MKEAILEQAVCALSALPFVKGVVLGGSRANGTETAGSDMDIGVYYDGAEFDLAALNEAARRLDSLHRENLVCGEGGWGNWVNCGGWLTMQETPVDLICREMGRVEQVVEECERGVFAAAISWYFFIIPAQYKVEVIISLLPWHANTHTDNTDFTRRAPWGSSKKVRSRPITRQKSRPIRGRSAPTGYAECTPTALISGNCRSISEATPRCARSCFSLRG